MFRVEEKPSRIGLRVDEVERAKVEAAASAAGLSMSEWARNALMSAVEAQSAPQIEPERPERSPEASRFIEAVRRAAERRG